LKLSIHLRNYHREAGLAGDANTTEGALWKAHCGKGMVTTHHAGPEDRRTQMTKPFRPVVIGANDLMQGDSIYLAADGWVRDISAAIVVSSDAEAEALLSAAAAQIMVVGAYTVEISLQAGSPWPVARREQIKASRDTTIPVGPLAETRAAA